MFTSLLVANRGEIAVRIIRTARRLGIRTVAIHSEADADALHVRMADVAVPVGPAPVQRSYLDQQAVLRAGLENGVEAVHPGYGLFSENAEFAARVQEAGMCWVGPAPSVIAAMGDKIKARRMMAASGVPVARGTSTPPATPAEAALAAAEIGFPLMIKAAAGGGGIGMTAIESAEAVEAAFVSASQRAERMFGSPDVLLEQLIRPARHIEVQVMGLNDGRVLALGERDCSVQRRFQKVIEETPATRIDADTRARLLEAAVVAARAIDYRGAGTVEFLLDPRTEEFVFLEMNTRLQVEHPVTELVTGWDLVECQLRIAAGERLDHLDTPTRTGHAMEFRIYAEDPVRMLPSPGPIESWKQPDDPWVRIDSGYAAGTTVSSHYDPLVAKLCVSGATREQTLTRARAALAAIEIGPLTTNLPLLRRIVASPAFTEGGYHTRILDDLP